MSQCDFVRENRTKMPELVNRIQDHYCSKAAYCQCARFRIYQSLGTAATPPLMLPEQIEWSRQIIEEYGHDSSTDQQPAEA